MYLLGCCGFLKLSCCFFLDDAMVGCENVKTIYYIYILYRYPLWYPMDMEKRSMVVAFYFPHSIVFYKTLL